LSAVLSVAHGMIQEPIFSDLLQEGILSP